MKASSDPMHAKFKDADFSDAKPVAETPPLARLQAAAGGKTRITMRVDNEVLALFKAQAERSGGNYQTLMNEALKEFAHGLKLADVVRDAVHESMAAYLPGGAPSTKKQGKG